MAWMPKAAKATSRMAPNNDSATLVLRPEFPLVPTGSPVAPTAILNVGWVAGLSESSSPKVVVPGESARTDKRTSTDWPTSNSTMSLPSTSAVQSFGTSSSSWRWNNVLPVFVISTVICFSSPVVKAGTFPTSHVTSSLGATRRPMVLDSSTPLSLSTSVNVGSDIGGMFDAISKEHTTGTTSF